MTAPAEGDPIVGLEVADGKVFYLSRSALLLSGSTYFASRFGRHWDEKGDFCDDRGREVFFLGRCTSSTFEYIYRYLMTTKINFPKDTDLSLLRLLRQEALFLGWDAFAEALKTSCSFSPIDGSQGVLYWLGTKKGTAEYTNPFLSGAINVEGCSCSECDAEIGGASIAKASFVGYRQNAQVSLQEDGNIVSGCVYELLGCDAAHYLNRAATVDLKSILLRPSHYSLRAWQCSGMSGLWNFEGSQDGEQWEVLHEARNDENLHLTHEPWETKLPEIHNRVSEMITHQDLVDWTPERVSELFLTVLETSYRYTWKLDPTPTKFYRYFRIIAKDTGYRFVTCLHGEGLELFGDVSEE